MRTGLSFIELVGATVVAGFISIPLALAEIPEYSTDMAEPDIVAVKNENCCDNTKLLDQANVVLKVEHALWTGIRPLNIKVFDDSGNVLQEFRTGNRIVYMHLPEGSYRISVNGLMDHKTILVDASYDNTKHFVL